MPDPIIPNSVCSVRYVHKHSPTTIGFAAKRRETAINKAIARLQDYVDQYKSVQHLILMSAYTNDALVEQRKAIKRKYYALWHKVTHRYHATLERAL